LNKPLKNPDCSYDCDSATNPDISVTVQAKDICPRYLGHYIYDVRHFESPQQMKRRLSVCGFGAIDAIVDVTNYVLLEIGQPMHAYDLSTLDGSSIVVRRANEVEEIVTLDEKPHTLTPNNLLICDKSKGVGLAGIMGGLNSEIVPETKEILLESAKFARDNVRKTSRALGLHTDAAARFEKGVDEYGVEMGMARALNLVQSLGIAKVSSSHFDESAGASTKERVITVQTAKVNGVLGIEVPEDRIVSILKSLGFGVAQNGGGLEITIPRWREDIEGYQDIAEEVIREYGYEHVTPTFLDSARVTNGGLSPAQNKELFCKRFLCSEGYYEIQTLAMYSRRELALLMLPENAVEHNAIELL
ncbi:MAG: phenylalanine--tRNA ligase subunit beta, partial [Oscillospiraceae bacterium]|nr:phenylalanine--tRNA ligase subunit beta [Oscillospiraceae bacterium]